MTDRTIITSMLESIAGVAVVHIDDLTLGTHPDPELRDAGELALLDWSQNGGPIVADGEDAALELIRRTSPARALGAALLAAVNADDLGEQRLLEVSLAINAVALDGATDGGPDDRYLRLGLCARLVALGELGNYGDHVPLYDSHWRERSAPSNYQRQEARLPIDGRDFLIYDAIAHLPLTTSDRAMLAPSA